MKMLFFIKAFFVKTVPAWFSLFVVFLKNSATKIAIIVGSWEAWSVKKLLRHVIRFGATFVARFTILTLLINWFDGRERKGIKNLPHWVILKVRYTRLGRIIDWWRNASDRKKRLVSGAIVCVLLIAFGQAMLGISILVFDIVWELLILLWRASAYVGRVLFPIVLRLIPNAIGTFVTNKIIPFFAKAIPLIRHDVKVIFIRSHMRERLRDYKKSLLKLGRNTRPRVRDRIRPIMPLYIRQQKNTLLSKAAKVEKSSNDSSEEE